MHKKHNMKRVGIYLPDLQIKKLDKLVKQMGLSRSEYIRRAIDDYFMYKELSSNRK